ncbi:MAG: hypothetical protein ACBR50_24650 [Microcoleus sp.]
MPIKINAHEDDKIRVSTVSILLEGVWRSTDKEKSYSRRWQLPTTI